MEYTVLDFGWSAYTFSSMKLSVQHVLLQAEGSAPRHARLTRANASLANVASSSADGTLQNATAAEQPAASQVSSPFIFCQSEAAFPLTEARFLVLKQLVDFEGRGSLQAFGDELSNCAYNYLETIYIVFTTLALGTKLFVCQAECHWCHPLYLTCT